MCLFVRPGSRCDGLYDGRFGDRAGGGMGLGPDFGIGGRACGGGRCNFLYAAKGGSDISEADGFGRGRGDGRRVILRSDGCRKEPW